MKPLFGILSAALVLAATGLAVPGTQTNPASVLTPHEIAVLKCTAAAVRLFQERPGAVWPGYDLARQPFLVYIPEKWALLVNPPGEVEGFAAPPAGWPEIGTKAVYHAGTYRDLVGNLVFDFPVAGVKVAAVGMLEEMASGQASPVAFFTDYLIHENFHQFQSQAFGEIPWAREERYPILDVENSALAYLEMAVLKEALRAIEAKNRAEIEKFAGLFAAIRKTRWDRGSSFLRDYERGQDIREGTAQYVQIRSLELRKELFAAAAGSNRPFPEDPGRISVDEFRRDAFSNRMMNGWIEPDDMIRNRIYPVGSTLGFLADRLSLDWKPAAQKAGTEFAFHEILEKALFSEGIPAPKLLEEAKKRYGFPAVLEATTRSIEDYRADYQKAIGEFESQPGIRIEIGFSYRSLNRSRSSAGKRWVVDDGGASYCSLYRVYTLKNDDLSLQVKGQGVLEKDDWDRKTKRTVFFIPALAGLRLDDRDADDFVSGTREFKTLEAKGDEFTFLSRKGGRMIRDGRTVVIELQIR